MSKFSKGLTFGLLSGAVFGSFIALLYAPDKGTNTRDRLSYRLNTYLDDLTNLVDQLKEEKDDIMSDAKKQSDQVVEDAQRRAEDLISEAEGLLESIKKAKNEAEEVEAKAEEKPENEQES
ncbi:MAG TPA: YtxH domain-containing protein [Balneolales bacterium]|nr:YtxH domain-containing protein [Balneolales bacterium]